MQYVLIIVMGIAGKTGFTTNTIGGFGTSIECKKAGQQVVSEFSEWNPKFLCVHYAT